MHILEQPCTAYSATWKCQVSSDEKQLTARECGLGVSAGGSGREIFSRFLVRALSQVTILEKSEALEPLLVCARGT